MRMKDTISADEIGSLEDTLPELRRKKNMETTDDIEAIKRANVEGLNKLATVYFKKELEEEEEVEK